VALERLGRHVPVGDLEPVEYRRLVRQETVLERQRGGALLLEQQRVDSASVITPSSRPRMTSGATIADVMPTSLLACRLASVGAEFSSSSRSSIRIVSFWAIAWLAKWPGG
jgi:hypothetical protein